MKRKAIPKTFGNHAPDWEPSASDASTVSSDVRTGLVTDELSDLGRQEGSHQSQADMRSAFGEPIDEPGGKVRWSVDTRNRNNRGILKEMTTPRRRVMIERAGKMNARPKARLHDRVTGQERVCLAEFEDQLGRTGNLRPTIRWGGNRVLSGPDGMLFREFRRGRWEPLGRKCLGTPLDDSDPFDVSPVQISPNGEIWMKDARGEWRRGGLAALAAV